MKRPDIIFIDPLTKFMEAQKALGIKATGSLPHLGIGTLASVMEREGCEVEIIDAVALNYSNLEVAAMVIKKSPKYVGLTAMTQSIDSAATIATLVKEKNLDTKIIIGGVHITAVPEETFKKYPSCFDVAVLGEGEVTLLELIKSFENKISLSNIDGIGYFEDGKFIRTKKRDLIKDLDTIPFPAWHLLPDLQHYYRPTLISSGSKLSNHLITSRGCPAKCIFCDTSVNGHKVRGYSADYVLEMIEILHKKYKINDIQINDDTFVTLRKRMLEICNKLIKKNYNLTWSCDARAGDVTEAGLATMKEAGCWQIAYGVETGSQRVMDFLQKNVTFEQIYNAFRWTKNVGISTKGFFIFGHPTETMESLQETVDIILKVNADTVGITFFTVFPGSPIYSTIGKYGDFDSDWDKTNTYEAGNFIPHGFTPEELIIFRKKTLNKFYLRPKNILKQIASIQRPYDVAKLLHGGYRLLLKNL